MARRDRGSETPAPAIHEAAKPNVALLVGVVKGTLAEGPRPEEGAPPAWALYHLEDGRYRLDRGGAQFAGDASHLAQIVLATNHEGVYDFTRDEQEELASVLGFDLPELGGDEGDSIA